MTNSSIIFVWIGLKLPIYARKSLQFCNMNNPQSEILLLTNATNTSALRGEINIVYFGNNEIHKLRCKLPQMQYKGEFWENTSLRFLLLNEYVDNTRLKSFFHAELDNFIFNLYGLDSLMNNLGNGIFAPRDAVDRAISSLIYCNRGESLSDLVGLYSCSRPPLNDMDAMGKYACKYQHYFHALPTESFLYNSTKYPLVKPEIISGIFDAAAIGQYILGVDPIHYQFKPCWNGFVNENCNIDLNSVDFLVEDSRIFIQYKASGIKFQIFNIHLHSKNWKMFHKIMLNGDVLKKLNNGDKSIISNHLMILVGPMFSVIYRFLALLRRMYKCIIREIF